MSTTLDESELREVAATAGQEHVFAFWEELDSAGRENLLREVAGVDFGLVAELARLRTAGPAQDDEEPPIPPSVFPLKRSADQKEHALAARRLGEDLLSGGKVAYVLVAGGQASRLGYDGPKGAFPVGPVTGRTLFEVHARRLRAAALRYGCRTPWFVMTSQANDAPTRAIFEENGHFGLPAEDVVFFSQDMIPALDDDGKILLSRKAGLFLAPNGHGGVLGALATSGALGTMRERGVDLISYFQVDNPLVRPADPLFLGLHRRSKAGMSTKVVEKTEPDEKVGVLGVRGGRIGIVEYSDLSEELRQARDSSGRLRFRAGNIAVHALDVKFAEEVTRGGLQLPWHLARKRMTVAGGDGSPVDAWGTKFETFVFDALARSPVSVTLEVQRALEFSPVKNAEGSDSPATARADLCRLFAGWVRAAGLELPAGGEDGLEVVEVDPLLAEDEGEFLAVHGEGRAVRTELETGHLYEPRG